MNRQSGNVGVYAIDGNTGALSLRATPHWGCRPPTGACPIGTLRVRHELRVPHGMYQTPSTVSAFVVSGEASTPISGAPFEPALVRSRLSCILPRGSPMSRIGSNGISAYLDRLYTGVLTANVPGSPSFSWGRPLLHGDGSAGRFIYVPNTSGNSVSAYSVDQVTGSLTPVPGSPFAAGGSAQSATVDPSAVSSMSQTPDHRTFPVTGSMRLQAR